MEQVGLRPTEGGGCPKGLFAKHERDDTKEKIYKQKVWDCVRNFSKGRGGEIDLDTKMEPWWEEGEEDL